VRRPAHIKAVPDATLPASVELEARLRGLVGDRIAAGLTQNEIAQRLDKSKQELSRLLTRPLTGLPIGQLVGLLKACDISIRVEAGDPAPDEEATAFDLGPSGQTVRGDLIRFLFDLLAREFEAERLGAEELGAALGEDQVARVLFSDAWLRRNRTHS